MLKKIRISNYLTDVFVLSLILSDYSLFFIRHSAVVYLCTFISGVGIIFFSRTLKVKVQDVFVLIYFILSIAVLLFAGSGFTDKTFIILALLLIVSYLAIMGVGQRNGIKSFFLSFVKMVNILAILSIIGFFLGTLLGILKPIEYIGGEVVNWSHWYGYKNYYYFYYEGQSAYFFGFSILRNMGVFAEAPLFATLLSEAIFINVLLLKRDMRKSIIMIIAALTTFSTTSIAIVSIVVFVYFYEKNLKNKKRVIVIPVMLVFVSYIVGIVLYDKLLTGNISGSMRIEDVIACFKSWQNSPIIGNGFKNIDILMQYKNAGRISGSRGLSTGVGGAFSDGGIILGLLYSIPFVYSLMTFFKAKDKSLVGLILMLFLIFFVMISHYTVLGMFWIAFSWYCVVNIKNKNVLI